MARLDRRKPRPNGTDSIQTQGGSSSAGDGSTVASLPPRRIFRRPLSAGSDETDPGTTANTSTKSKFSRFRFRGGPMLSAATSALPKAPSPTKSVSFDDNEVEISALTEFATEQTPLLGHRDSNGSLAGKMVVLGPCWEFLTADATLFLLASLVLSSLATYQSWSRILTGDTIPRIVIASWLLVAYALGLFTAYVKFHLDVKQEQALLAKAPVSVEQQVAQHLVIAEQRLRRHSVLDLLAQKMGLAKLSFRSLQQPVQRYWTTLNQKSRQLLAWERAVDPTMDQRNQSLMKRLLRNPNYKRMLKRDWHTEQAAMGKEVIDLALSVKNCHKMGQFDLDEAETLKEMVIVPATRLRGMDVFMTDDPESNVSTHPWLIEHGLRSVPTLVVNLITPWANLLVYMEMPSWVVDIDGLEEDDDDEDDDKALKRWLNGNDVYRNARLKMIPSLVDGPLAVKVLAPPKKEFSLSCDMLPVRYHKHRAETDAKGRLLHPILEVEIDCAASRPIRAMAGILKRNLVYLSMDAALVIGKPEKQVEDEPEACLGLFRFNYIDVSTCPKFPDRFLLEAKKTGKDPDVIRASSVARLDPHVLEELSLLSEEEDDEILS